ncbi:hypothetical protein BS50DRAFT_295369 [Corynespora cassiicola Philippines]|uniref:Cytochrome P450 n=1 Tax=Corynespora cassiicola Philippines TaxID=1448308 RepID=A0A2T2NWK2_CORCC|nr:hypothetical protein BS50DRAFT_295369 [Corynespora cassiicola Philippines]
MKCHLHQKEFIERFHAAVFGTGLRVMLGRLKCLAPKAAYVDACKRAHDYVEYYIRHALEDLTLHGTPSGNHMPHHKQRSVVQGLAMQTEDMGFIRGQILQGMLAAQETISVLVCNTMFLLARHPMEWVQLRTQVLSHGEALFDFHRLYTFGPLQRILNETLRLYPVLVKMTAKNANGCKVGLFQS